VQASISRLGKNECIICAFKRTPPERRWVGESSFTIVQSRLVLQVIPCLPNPYTHQLTHHPKLLIICFYASAKRDLEPRVLDSTLKPGFSANCLPLQTINHP
jgi:hypothetical protein